MADGVWREQDLFEKAEREREAGSLVGLRDAHERIVTLDRRIRAMVAAQNFNGVRPLIEAYLNATPPTDDPAVGLRDALRLVRETRDVAAWAAEAEYPPNRLGYLAFVRRLDEALALASVPAVLPKEEA